MVFYSNLFSGKNTGFLKASPHSRAIYGKPFVAEQKIDIII